MRLKISSLINSFGLIVAIATLAVALFAAAMTSQIRIGGALYDKINQGKDLVADILPPPEYVIEAYLEATLALDKSKPLAESKARLEQLHKDYDERREVWQKSDLPSALIEKLTKKSDGQVQLFWNSVERQLLPALERGDHAAADSAYKSASQVYVVHRAVIDEVVSDANDLNTAIESEAEARGKTVLIATSSVVGGLLLFVVCGVIFINGRAVKPITRITRVMSEISSGKVDVDVPGADRRDEIGEMAKSVLVFRDNLARVKIMEAERAEARGRRTRSGHAKGRVRIRTGRRRTRASSHRRRFFETGRPGRQGRDGAQCRHRAQLALRECRPRSRRPHDDAQRARRGRSDPAHHRHI